jgi:geranylgeranyl diphosphate synthase, type I
MHRTSTLTAGEAPAVGLSDESSANVLDESSAAKLGDRLTALRRRVDAGLADWLARRRAALAAEVPEADALVAAVERLAAGGGKRLRPALVEAAWRTAGGDDDRAAGDLAGVTALGLATELLHTYLLIHDDIMDHAPLRRGVPTVHETFAARHRADELGGDAADFGATVAILAGDLAHSWAHELFAAALAPLDDAGRRRALAASFAATGEEVVAGQYLEVLLARRGRGSADELGRVLRLKSGRYSVERPLELGALYAGAPPPLLDALGRCGRALGEAFQLQDDLLGTFGEADAVGKPVASDLAEGKVTFLVHHALAAAPPEDARRLAAALGSGELAPDVVADLRRILETSGARARVESMAAESVAAARRALADAADAAPDSPAAAEGLALLAGLVDLLAERRS